MSPTSPVELDDLRRAVQAGAHDRALSVPVPDALADPDAEVVRVTYRAVSFEAIGERARAIAECDAALARLHDAAAIGRIQVCAAAIAEHAGQSDEAQTRLGVAVTAFGRASRAHGRSSWLEQSRAWAMVERARLLRRLGRPQEAERLESAGRRALEAHGVAPMAATPATLAS
ncbi:MAG: hypothetical protein ACOYNI_08725 [Acidimicrobiia bacterium]